MKRLIKLGLLSQLVCATQLYALNPVEGFYGGLLGEISHGPSNSDVIFTEDSLLFHGKVGYSSVSAGAGFMLGYKINHLRGELEFLMNRISTGPVTVGTCTIQNQNIVTPTGLCPASEYDHFKAKALGYSGSSTAMYGFFNAFWDFFSYEGSSVLVPYVGLGIGQSSVKNESNFVSTNTSYSHGQSIINKGSAMQGIVGISYYMDDFTWATMDFRYLSSKPKQNQNTGLDINLPVSNYILSTLNFTINFAFDKGAVS